MAGNNIGQPPKRVEVLGVGIVEFPGDMSEAAITKVLSREFPKPQGFDFSKAKYLGPAPEADEPFDFSKARYLGPAPEQNDDPLGLFPEQKKKPAQNESLLGDTGTALNIGTTVAIPEQVLGVNSFLGKASPLSQVLDTFTPDFLKRKSAEVEGAARAGLQGRRQALQANYTPETQAATQKEFFGEDATWKNLTSDGIAGVPAKTKALHEQGAFFGDAWSDPRKIYVTAVESLPGTVATMGPTALGARMTYTNAIKAGATQEAAQQAAERFAMLAGGAAEGVQGAGAGYEATRQKVLAMPLEELARDENFKLALDTVDPSLPTEVRLKAARLKAAEAAAMVSAAGSGLFDSVFGALGDRYLGTAAAGGQGAVKAAAKGTLQELPTEAVQSGGEQFSENLGIRNFANAEQDLMAGVGEEAVTGGLAGALTGGVMGGEVGRVAGRPQTPEEVLISIINGEDNDGQQTDFNEMAGASGRGGADSAHPGAADQPNAPGRDDGLPAAGTLAGAEFSDGGSSAGTPGAGPAVGRWIAGVSPDDAAGFDELAGEGNRGQGFDAGRSVGAGGDIRPDQGDADAGLDGAADLGRDGQRNSIAAPALRRFASYREALAAARQSGFNLDPVETEDGSYELRPRPQALTAEGEAFAGQVEAVSYAEAEALRNGSDAHSVVPHPTGEGFMLIPREWIATATPEQADPLGLFSGDQAEALTITRRATGELLVAGPAAREKILAAVPGAKTMQRGDGSILVGRRHAEQVEAALASVQPARYPEQVPDAIAGDIPLERDDEGSIPDAGRADSLERRDSAGRAGAEAGARPVLAVRQSPDEPGLYNVKTQLVTTGEHALPVDRVQTWQDSARVFSKLSRFAVEHMDGLVVDAEGRPLAMIGGFKGGPSQATIDVAALIGELSQIDGAAGLWLAHNHPSGNPELSDADRRVAQNLAELLRDSGVTFHGLAALGRDGGKVKFSTTEHDAGEVSADEPGAFRVPIVEREIVEANAGEAITGPAQAKRLVQSIARDNPGVVFVDAQNRVSAFVPFDGAEMGELRRDGRLMRLFRAASTGGATGAIIAMPGGRVSVQDYQNAGRALGAAGVRVLDGIRYDSADGPAESLLAAGIDSPAPSTAFKAEGDVGSSAGVTRLRAERYLEQSVGRTAAKALLDTGAVTFVDNEADLDRLTGAKRFATKAKGLLAPNGKPSKLNPVQWHLVRTPAFKAWFGDWENDPANASKAIDRETGEPAVLWHGSTRAGFSEFTPNEHGLIWASSNRETGASYGGSFDQADLWAGSTGKGLVPVFVNARDPAETDAAGEKYYAFPDVENLGYTDWFGAQAKRAGKDGAVIRNIIDDGGMLPEESEAAGDDWVVFDSRQIKSATGNVGTFDPQNPDIRFSRNLGATLPDGRIALVLENLDDSNFEAVLQHEALHATLRSLIGEATYTRLMGNLSEQLRLGKGAAWVKAAAAAVPANTPAAHRTEEIAAYAVQQYAEGAKLANPLRLWVEKFLAALRAGILRFAPNGRVKDWAARTVTPATLSKLAIAGLKAKAAGKLETTTLPATRYSQSAATDRQTLRAKARGWIAQNRGWMLGALTRDQLADIYSAGIPEAAEFDHVAQKMDQARNALAERADEIIERWRRLSTDEADRLADVMHQATIEQFDPADPQAAPSGIEQRAIAKAWAALTPEAKALYREVRDTYEATLIKMRNGLSKRAERAGTAGKKIAAQIRLEFDRALSKGPYFPLSRFGDLLLIGRSPTGERTVEAFESGTARDARAAELRRAGYQVKLTAKRDYNAATDAPAADFVGQVLKLIDGATMDARQKSALMDDLNQLSIAMLPDQSARKHFAHRKAVPGFSQDAMRAFAAAMQHAGHHLARVLHGDELQLTLDGLHKRLAEAKGDADLTEAQQVANELGRRLEYMLNPNTHPVAAALGQVGFVMSLGGSVAAGLVNLTQTPLVTFPWLGAKFGWGAASQALTKASKDYFAGKWDRWSGFVVKDSPALTADERKAMRELEDAGLVNLSQAHDLAGVANTDRTTSKRAFAVNRAMKVVSWTFHLPEVFNRQVSGLAAYRLARSAGKSHEAAVELAGQTLRRTHFDYSASNRARWMQGNVARVVTMFKQYSQNMTYMLWRNAYLALKSETPEVRREARRMLLGVGAMHFAAAGSLGLPLGVFGISPLLALLAMGMGDDDEPFDWQTEYRNWLADTFGKAAGEAIAKGPARLLVDVDIASRVGLGELWVRPPQGEHEGRDLVEAWMLTLAGPVAGYVGNLGTAAQAFNEGKFSRGVEALVPKFIRDPLKALRYEREGVTSWKGDDLGVNLDGDDLFAQAIGFQPAALAEMFEGRAAVKGKEARLQNRASELRRMWVEASLAGDQGMRAEVLDQVKAFNEKNPAMRITGQSLRQAVATKRRNARQIEDGIFLTKKREPLREAGRFANVQRNDDEE